MEFKTYNAQPSFTTGYTDVNNNFHPTLQKALESNKQLENEHNTYLLADHYFTAMSGYTTVFQVQEVIKKILLDPQPFIELYKLENKIS